MVTTKFPEYFNAIVKWNFPHEEEQERLEAVAAKTRAMEQQKNEALYAIHRAENLYTNYRAVKTRMSWNGMYLNPFSMTAGRPTSKSPPTTPKTCRSSITTMTMTRANCSLPTTG